MSEEMEYVDVLGERIKDLIDDLVKKINKLEK